MSKIIDKIDKLIQQGNSITWENSSYTNNNNTFGQETAALKTWASRIRHILNQSVKPNSEPFIHYNTAGSIPIQGNYRDKFDLAKESYLEALYSLKNLINEGDIFDELQIKKDSKESITVDEFKTKSKINKDCKKVFIVHGHDHNLKIELEVFLSHIGLKPIVLHREVDEGKTIIEKFEANSDVAYVFILLTPDEIAYKIDQKNIEDSKRNIEFRARPNVIFEFGYFIAKLGRKRVCVLYKGDVSIPSDLNGFIYKKIDTDIEEIGFSLIKELKAAKLKIDL